MVVTVEIRIQKFVFYGDFGLKLSPGLLDLLERLGYTGGRNPNSRIPSPFRLDF
jgi:hypothetical protein